MLAVIYSIKLLIIYVLALTLIRLGWKLEKIYYISVYLHSVYLHGVIIFHSKLKVERLS